MQSFYLSDPENLDQASELTGLSADELELIVGRFTKQSSRAGQLKGELVVYPSRVVIRHHFSKKKLWECDLLLEDLDERF